MSGPLVTVSHDESAHNIQTVCSTKSVRVGLDVQGSVTYAPGETHEALEAVDRLAESLRRQIADAAERTP